MAVPLAAIGNLVYQSHLHGLEQGNTGHLAAFLTWDAKVWHVIMHKLIVRSWLAMQEDALERPKLSSHFSA